MWENKEKTERNIEIKRLANAGAKYRDLAVKFDLTYQRIQQIVYAERLKEKHGERAPSEMLTDEERAQIDIQMTFGVCKCGHPRNEHHKYVSGRFVGCQHENCDCDQFDYVK